MVYTTYTHMLENPLDEHSVSLMPLDLSFDIREADVETGKPLPDLPDISLKKATKCFDGARARWENIGMRKQLLDILTEKMAHIDIDKVVGIALGSFGKGKKPERCTCCGDEYGEEEGSSDSDCSGSDNGSCGSEEDHEDVPINDRTRVASQHVLLLQLRDFFDGKKTKGGCGAEGIKVKCLVQDPEYREVDREVLKKEGVTVVNDPEGVLEVDEKSVVVCVCPDFPARQILADIAKPAVVIWDRVENLPAPTKLVVDDDGTEREVEQSW